MPQPSKTESILRTREIRDGTIDAGLLLLVQLFPGERRLSNAEIAYVCGCHRGRIQQIERAALKKIRNRIIFGSLRHLKEELSLK